jgi:hypothetical protein
MLHMRSSAGKKQLEQTIFKLATTNLYTFGEEE